MNILCNLPLECFESRDRFNQRLVTFGPPDRMWVEGEHYPFDVAFDPSSQSIEELLTRLPRDFAPDVLLLYWPDQEPLPDGLERCPCPVVGAISDYNLTLPHLTGLWPFFDLLLVDHSGVELMQRLGFADVRPFCQFSFKRHHRVYPEQAATRPIDVGFVGNLSPVVQSERMPWIHRMLGLGERGLRVDARCRLFGADYGRYLSGTKLGFNRSIRGEMNLRAFEVPACGALLLMEAENLEVREFLTPGEEVALYTEDDFEDVVTELLADTPRRERMALAGHERIREQSMSRRLDELESLLSTPATGRPASTEYERALGRGTAMLSTWAPEAAPLRCLLRAHELAPADDPRATNALALALLRADTREHGQRAAELLCRAGNQSPTYLPALLNLSYLTAGGADAEVERRLACGALDWPDVDGPVMPMGFAERPIAIARALRDAVLEGDLAGHLGAWAPAVQA